MKMQELPVTEYDQTPIATGKIETYECPADHKIMQYPKAR